MQGAVRGCRTIDRPWSDVRVAVTGVGGGVGQAVLRALRWMSPALWVLGLDMNPHGAGLYLSDGGAGLPPCTDAAYLPRLTEILERERIDVLIPGSDPELPILARARPELERSGLRVLVGAPEPIDICRDKQRCAEVFRAHGFPFVYTVPVGESSRLADEIGYPLVLKPAGGSASRGVRIVFSESELEPYLSQPETIAQEPAFPQAWTQEPGGLAAEHVFRNGTLRQEEEVSIQVIHDHEGCHLGTFTSINRLQGGVPVFIDPQTLPQVETLAEAMVGFLRDRGLIGPCNVQCRLTENGPKVFEINPRFTGITGLRAAMGFNAVQALLERWLCDRPVSEVRASLRRLNGHIGVRFVDEAVVDRARMLEIDS